MRKGKDILHRAIGRRLEQGRFQSFYLNGELVDLVDVTFLKFGNWLRFVTTDDMSSVSEMDEEFEEINDYGDEEFNYPISALEGCYSEITEFYGSKLLDVKELVWRGDERMSYGFNFYFEGGRNLILHNKPYPEDKNELIFKNKVPEDLSEKQLFDNVW